MVMGPGHRTQTEGFWPYLLALVIFTLMVFLEKVKPVADSFSQPFFSETVVVANSFMPFSFTTLTVAEIGMLPRL